jgi:hypothetical protein
MENPPRKSKRLQQRSESMPPAKKRATKKTQKVPPVWVSMLGPKIMQCRITAYELMHITKPLYGIKYENWSDVQKAQVMSSIRLRTVVIAEKESAMYMRWVLEEVERWRHEDKHAQCVLD